MQFIISILLALLIFSCQTPVQDSSSPAINSGLKRVETVICGNHSVGENGCVFPEGNISGSLDIFAYFSGTVLLTSSNCMVDKKISYDMKQAEWISLDLKSLVGNKLSQDCVISILQTPIVPKQDQLEFPIYPLKGTVTLGECPANVICKGDFTQKRFGAYAPTMSIGSPGYNQIVAQGCGETLLSGEFTDEINLDLVQLWPKNTPYKGNSGCLFIVGVKGHDKYKFYNKIWLYDQQVLTMAEPLLELKNNKVNVTGDKSTLYTIIDGDYARGNTGKVDKKDVHYIRFYTSAGRTMIVKINNGAIEWTK